MNTILHDIHNFSLIFLGIAVFALACILAHDCPEVTKEDTMWWFVFVMSIVGWFTFNVAFGFLG